MGAKQKRQIARLRRQVANAGVILYDWMRDLEKANARASKAESELTRSETELARIRSMFDVDLATIGAKEPVLTVLVRIEPRLFGSIRGGESAYVAKLAADITAQIKAERDKGNLC